MRIAQAWSLSRAAGVHTFRGTHSGANMANVLTAQSIAMVRDKLAGLLLTMHRTMESPCECSRYSFLDRCLHPSSVTYGMIYIVSSLNPLISFVDAWNIRSTSQLRLRTGYLALISRKILKMKKALQVAGNDDSGTFDLDDLDARLADLISVTK